MVNLFRPPLNPWERLILTAFRIGKAAEKSDFLRTVVKRGALEGAKVGESALWTLLILSAGWSLREHEGVQKGPLVGLPVLPLYQQLDRIDEDPDLKAFLVGAAFARNDAQLVRAGEALGRAGTRLGLQPYLDLTATADFRAAQQLIWEEFPVYRIKRYLESLPDEGEWLPTVPSPEPTRR